MTDGLSATATAWMDRWWDPAIGLLWNMEGAYDELAPPRSLHLVPPSAWYAVGLLRRGADGDAERAVRTIEALVATQYDEPGTVWHGTFAQFHEAPHPPPDAREWVDYDPNWRQFVGTTFALALADHGDVIPAAAAELMRGAIELAVRGEPEGRVPAWYANIALMKAWLDVEAGRVAEGERFAEEVVETFRRTDAFLEYGSPTYYGIDLYALALWRSRSSSALLRAWGEEIEAALWRDIGRWYHAGLRNLCGPYARAYGMDMTSYAALLGLWVWDGLGPAVAPFPAVDRPFGHAHDLCLAPCVEALGARIPADVIPRLERFGGERLVEQVVDPDVGLVATGWLSDHVMIGAGRGGGFHAVHQYHPATIHWRAPDGRIAWLRVVHNGPVDAVAGEGQLTVTTHDHPRRGPTDTTIMSSHKGTFEQDRWSFPGLDLRVTGSPVPSRDGTLPTAGTTSFELHVV